MTKNEWDSILEDAIRESGKDAKILSSGCSATSNRCFATIEEPATGKLTEVGVDGQEGAAKMQKSVARQLLADESTETSTAP